MNWALGRSGHEKVHISCFHFTMIVDDSRDDIKYPLVFLVQMSWMF